MGRNHLADDVRVDPRSRLGHRLLLQLPAFLVIVALWLTLWGDVSIANLLGGLLVATLVVGGFHPGRRERLGHLRPLAAIRFVSLVIANLARSTAAVAWETATPGDRTRPGIIAVELPSATPVVLTAVTAAIGLTPGTLVIDLDRDPTVLYVHVLHLHDEDEERSAIRHLEASALAAFGPTDAGDDIDRLEHPSDEPRSGAGSGGESS